MESVNATAAVFGFAALVAVGLARVAAQPGPSAEEVKAAFLCSFSEFVEWPGPASGTITIEIIGTDPFGRRLDETARARQGSRAIAIRRAHQLAAAGQREIAFISASELADLDAVLAKLAGSPVLTVSDIPGFAARGGMIGFVLEDRRVRFEINLAAAERAGLRISSRLLNLARLVPDAPGETP